MKSKIFVLGCGGHRACWLCLGGARTRLWRHEFSEMMRNSFRDEGIAKTDRLVQDQPTQLVRRRKWASS